MATHTRWAYIYTGERWEQLDPQYNAFLLEYEQERVNMHHQHGPDPFADHRYSENILINGRDAFYFVVVEGYEARIVIGRILFRQTGTSCQLAWDYEEDADTSTWREGWFTRGNMQSTSQLIRARARKIQ